LKQRHSMTRVAAEQLRDGDVGRLQLISPDAL
jgi:hypothetical protein